MSSIHAPSASGTNLLLNASTGASPFGRGFGWSHSRLFEPFSSSSPLARPAPFPPFAFRCTMPGRCQRPGSFFVAFRCIFLIACFEVVTWPRKDLLPRGANLQRCSTLWHAPPACVCARRLLPCATPARPKKCSSLCSGHAPQTSKIGSMCRSKFIPRPSACGARR